jgi:hypothetical protein
MVRWLVDVDGCNRIRQFDLANGEAKPAAD